MKNREKRKLDMPCMRSILLQLVFKRMQYIIYDVYVSTEHGNCCFMYTDIYVDT